MSAILAVLAEKNIEYSVQAIQERNKWFVPIIYPAHGQDIDPISMWLVLAEPRDRCPQSHYVMLTALHPNHPMIRKVWTWTGPEDPVQGRIQMFEGINDK